MCLDLVTILLAESETRETCGNIDATEAFNVANFPTKHRAWLSPYCKTFCDIHRGKKQERYYGDDNKAA